MDSYSLSVDQNGSSERDTVPTKDIEMAEIATTAVGEVEMSPMHTRDADDLECQTETHRESSEGGHYVLEGAGIAQILVD